MRKPKRIGWVGIVDDAPNFDRVADEYGIGSYIPVASVYRSKKEALRRFEQAAPVFIDKIGPWKAKVKRA